MRIWFFVFALGVIMALPLHFLSVEHRKLRARYGPDKGNRIAETYGRVSGYLMFFSLIGIWLAPQPRFDFLILPSSLFLFVPLSSLGAFLLCNSVSGLSRKVSEAHRPEKVVTTGIYAVVRHPQYLGFLLVHAGFSFLLSAWFALLSTPVLFLMLFLMARKEETELVQEFGQDYAAYRRKVPMLVPKFGK